MKYRKLRIAFSATCVIVAVLLIVLWVRSYWVNESLTYCMPLEDRVADSWLLDLTSNHGVLSFDKTMRYMPDSEFFFERWNYHRWGRIASDEPRWGFHYDQAYESLEVDMPYCIAVFSIAILAVLTWLPFNRFSLRTLLIATTLLAIGLGLIVWAVR